MADQPSGVSNPNQPLGIVELVLPSTWTVSSGSWTHFTLRRLDAEACTDHAPVEQSLSNGRVVLGSRVDYERQQVISMMSAYL